VNLLLDLIHDLIHDLTRYLTRYLTHRKLTPDRQGRQGRSFQITNKLSTNLLVQIYYFEEEMSV
jgi:hypothetical protein